MSSGILGLGLYGTILLFATMIIFVLVLMTGGLLWALGFVLLAATALVLMVVRDRHHKSALDRAAVQVGWWSALVRGQNLYRSGPLGVTPWGTRQLPGVAAPTRLSEFTDSYGRPFVMVYSPASGTYAVVIETEPDGSALVDQEQIDAWVADFGRWLRNVGEEQGILGASVTIDTAPDSGSGLRREILSNLDPNAPEFARQTMLEVMNMYPAGSSSVRAFVTLTFSASASATGKRRPPEEMARDLGARIPNLTSDLEATGAGASAPMTAQNLCEYVRVAYDPAAAMLLDEAAENGESVPMHWSEVGPTMHEATRDGYRHENAFSCSWEMTEAPSGVVQSSILARLLAPRPELARKRVTILYRPIDPGQAKTIVESDVRSSNFRITATARPATRDVYSARAAQATANEEASGAGLVMFGMLVTATVMDVDRIADARATVENLGASAKLRLRPVYGSQDSAFAFSLPLGLIPNRHISAPSRMKEKL